MRFHIIASKQIKPCSCKTCRAKYGTYASMEEAEAALASLDTNATPLQEKNEELEFKNIHIPSSEESEFEDMHVELDPEIADRVKYAEPDVSKTDSYFDDDREFLKGDDEVLSVGPSSALIDQMENVVSWRIDNLYDESGKRRSRFALRTDPPVFRIEGSDGAAAEFVLTQNLSISLAENFETVKRAYYGVDPKKNTLTQGQSTSKLVTAQRWAADHPVKALLAVAVLLIFIITAFTL